LWSPQFIDGTQVLNSATQPNPIVEGLTQTTTFTLVVTDNVYGCVGTSTVTITVTPSSLTANAGTGRSYCAGSAGCTTLGGNPTARGGTGPYTYSWSNISGPGATEANPCVQPTVTTTYYVTVQDQLGCTSVDSVTVFVSPVIVVNAGNDTSVCYGQYVTLGGNPVATGGSGAYQYSWSPAGAPLNNSTIANPTVQGVTTNITYNVTVTDTIGCSGTGSISLNVRALPSVDAGLPVTLVACTGDSAVLGGNPTATGTVPPYTYSWTPPFDTSLTCLNCPNPIVSHLGYTTEFTVTVSDSFGCTNSDSVLVTVVPNTLFVNAGSNLPDLCTNGNHCVNLGGTPTVSGGYPAYNYRWFGAGITNNDTLFPNPQACPDTTTTYTVIVTDSHHCQASGSVTVIVNPPPVVSINGLNPTYCVSSPNVALTGTPSGGTFSGAVVGNVFEPALLGPGNYCITYTYTNPTTGCTGDTTVCVVVSPLPQVSIAGVSQGGYCMSDSAITLVGTPPGGIFTGNGITGNTFNPHGANVVAGNNVITYTYTDTLTGCSNTAQVTILIKANPTLSLAIASDTACSGSNVTITPTYSVDVFNIVYSQLGGSILGSGLNPFVVHPSGQNYCVTATAINTPNGCTVTDTICMYVYQPPVISQLADTIALCNADSLVINILSNVNDPQGHADNVTILVPPANGTLVSNGSGIYTYTPKALFFGLDSFRYETCNTSCSTTCDTGEVYLSVCYQVHPPVIVDTTITIYENDTAFVCPYIYDVYGWPLKISTSNCTALEGQLIFTSDSCFEFIPDTNWIGTQILCITVCDTTGLCDTGVITIHVIPTNRPPIAFPIQTYTCVNKAIGIDVAAATGDIDGNPLRYSYGQVTGPGRSTFDITSNGAVLFAAQRPGIYTIPYTVCDTSSRPVYSLCASSTITVTVLNCDSVSDDSIKANNDVVTTDTNVVTLINELANDYYTSPSQLVVTILQGPSLPGATYVVNPDGTITYQSPTPGIDTIVYEICDPAPLCSTATIIIYVDTVPYAPIIYPPVAVDDFDSTNYHQSVRVPVLDNDYSNMGDSLIVTAIPCPAGYGTTTINSDGTITYTPDPTSNAYTIDTFCYRICDADYPNLCDSATVVIYIRPSVFAVNQDTSICNHVPVTINLLNGAFTPDGDSIYVSQLLTPEIIGVATLNANGTVTYVPQQDTCNFTDTFSYVLMSALGARDTAQVLINVSCAPSLVFVQDSVSTPKNDSVVFNTFSNDTISGPVSGTVISGPSHGTAHYLNDTLLVYIPNGTYCGLDTVVYGGLTQCGSDTSLAIINVLCRTAPYAANDTESICKNDTLTFYILTHDTAQYGGKFFISGTPSLPFPPAAGQITSFVDSSGQVTFQSTGYTGQVTFTYTICDEDTPSLCSTGTVYININNCPPPKVPIIYDTTLINTPDTVCNVGEYVVAIGTWRITTLCTAQNGTSELLDSCFIYIPDTNYVGNDTFCLVICDSLGCDTTKVIMTVIDTTFILPDIACDADTDIMNFPVVIHELANAIIPGPGDTIVSIKTPPMNGIAVVDTDKNITYTPNTNYKGTDEFTFMVCADVGNFKPFCDTASVCVTVVDTMHECFIPNAFSPNGDGINDMFVIPCIDMYPLANLVVYDRWGMEVWNSNGPYQNNWGGTNQQGTRLPDGTYFVIYTYNNGSGRNEARFVVINR
jgi:gliding motility-associated-like protein